MELPSPSSDSWREEELRPITRRGFAILWRTCTYWHLPAGKDSETWQPLIVFLFVVSLYPASFDAPAFNIQNPTGRGPGALIVGKGE